MKTYVAFHVIELGSGFEATFFRANALMENRTMKKGRSLTDGSVKIWLYSMQFSQGTRNVRLLPEAAVGKVKLTGLAELNGKMVGLNYYVKEVEGIKKPAVPEISWSIKNRSTEACRFLKGAINKTNP